MQSSPQEQPEITFRDVFPELSDQELVEAEYRFRRYLEVALQICEKQGSRAETPEIDSSLIPPTMKERSNEILKD